MKDTILISLFRTVVDSKPVCVSVQQVVDGIRSGRWRKAVENIRDALHQGNKQAVADGKRALPFAAFSGVFEGGHRATQIRDYSQLVVLDYDKISDTTLLAEMRRRAAEHPSVVSAFITPSGQGLKVIVLTNGTAACHGNAYAQVACTFDQLLSCASDPACKDISRGHFVSYDPDITFRSDAVPFSVESSPVGLVPSDRESSGAPAGKQPSFPQNTRMELAAPAKTSTENVEPFSGSVGEFVRAWLILHPVAEGKRNNSLFRLSCDARKRGIARTELSQTVVSLLSEPGFDAREIVAVVRSAYSRREENEGENSSRSLPVPPIPPLCVNTTTSPEEEEELEIEKLTGEVLREQTPTFPKEVYEALPSLLNDALSYFDDSRERDMLLLGMLTTISSVLPNVTGRYNHKNYWPNLYTFVVAGPASNKSVLEYALSLCEVYFKQAMAQNKQLQTQYESELATYEKENRSRSRTKGAASTQKLLRPKEPEYFYPHIPADISKGALLEQLRVNGERGGLLFDTEADTLSDASKKDYGNFYDYLRKFYHHESTSCSFKINGRPLYLHRPRLALLVAGTPAQLGRLIPTSENGLFSRVLFYTYRQSPKWKDVSGGGVEDGYLERHFEVLAHRMVEIIGRLAKYPTQVYLSQKQWMQLNKFFSRLLQESALFEREDFQSCIKRHGLMAFRFCMIFTALDKVEQWHTSEKTYCKDEHFHAALSLAATCLEHSRLLITSIHAADQDIGELQNPDNFSLIMKYMPPRFTTREFLEAACRLDISKRTAEKLLLRANGLIVKRVSKGVYEIKT